jgi:acetylornithine deacetylase/succinyl-diaminopimelate desuccinylase-like protein
MDLLDKRIGTPSLVICLDASCGNYDQLWCTSSLRGLIAGTLRVEVLDQGVHSGDAGGIVPCSFRLLRQLLSRVEDETSGELCADIFASDIPVAVLEQAEQVAAIMGDSAFTRFPFSGSTRPVVDEAAAALLNGTWRASMTVTGADGIPSVGDAGNVLRPYTLAKLSFRLPPNLDARKAGEALKSRLESNPPCGAGVTFTQDIGESGWHSETTTTETQMAIDLASRKYFGAPAAYMGDGGAIPFMSMLGKRFPDAEFVVTGLLGPGSNAHGPNEFMHIPTVKKLTCCVAEVLGGHAAMRSYDS